MKRLDSTVGEIVEIAGRRYEVVPDREGGVTLEPPITPAARLHAQGVYGLGTGTPEWE